MIPSMLQLSPASAIHWLLALKTTLCCKLCPPEFGCHWCRSYGVFLLSGTPWFRCYAPNYWSQKHECSPPHWTGRPDSENLLITNFHDSQVYVIRFFQGMVESSTFVGTHYVLGSQVTLTLVSHSLMNVYTDGISLQSSGNARAFSQAQDL